MYMQYVLPAFIMLHCNFLPQQFISYCFLICKEMGSWLFLLQLGFQDWQSTKIMGVKYITSKSIQYN